MASRKAPVTLGQELNLSVERLAYHSGDGVAKADGFIIFVPFAAPGDQILARIVEVKPHHAKAKILEVKVAGPSRRVPICPVAGQCGGCHWQQVSYDEQIHQKQNLLIQHFRNLLSPNSGRFKPIIPSDNEFRYRNRIQLHKRGQKVGYFAAGTQKLVEISDCWIAEESLISNISHLVKSQKQDDGRYEIARHTDGTVTLRSAETGGAEGLFSQVNETQNRNLLNLLEATIKDLNPSEILDLYAGDGNITRTLLKCFPQKIIHAVELNKKLVDRAQADLTLAAGKIRWHAMPTEDFLRKSKIEPNSLIVLDPPRPGLELSCRQLILEKSPAQIVYVSCNPSTLVRDIEIWVKNGYEIQWVQGIDMFPQTAHLEAVCYMNRISFADKPGI